MEYFSPAPNSEYVALPEQVQQQVINTLDPVSVVVPEVQPIIVTLEQTEAIPVANALVETVTNVLPESTFGAITVAARQNPTDDTLTSLANQLIVVPS